MLAVSGDPRAAPIIVRVAGRPAVRATPTRRCSSRRTMASFIDAATGKPAPDVMASGLKPVRMNNAVRGAVDAALGSLRLFAPDRGDAPATPPRRCSIRTIPPHCRRWNERCRARRPMPAVKRRMEQARAAALLFVRRRQRSRPAGRDRRAARTRRHRQPQPARRPVRPAAGRGRRPPPPRSPRSIAILQLWSILQSVYYGLSASARCCCWPRPAWRSPSASWA